MSNLQIRKVTALPAVLAPSAMYLIQKPPDRLAIYLTDKTGGISYRSTDDTDITAIFNAMLSLLIGQPGGIAPLDQNGNVLGGISVSAIEGQDVTIASGGAPVWRTMTESIIALGNNSTANTRKYITTKGFTVTSFLPRRNASVFINFTLPLDYLETTSLIPRACVFPLSDASGNSLMELSYVILRPFPAGFITNRVIQYLGVTIPSNSREIPIMFDFNAITRADLQPGDEIKFKIRRIASDIHDTFNGVLALNTVQLSYQLGRLGTRNNQPNFMV